MKYPHPQFTPSLYHLSSILLAQISPPWLPSVTDLVEQLPPAFRPSSILLIGFNGDKFSADLAAAFQARARSEMESNHNTSNRQCSQLVLPCHCKHT